ncbi:hypothetical protein VRK_29520 [Vibrio sp. MEBiC08052]|nr:hypothetical protein VRK_29520 [Vibrio sp. MEBiC08052]
MLFLLMHEAGTSALLRLGLSADESQEDIIYYFGSNRYV